MQHSQLNYIDAGIQSERALWATFPLRPCTRPCCSAQQRAKARCSPCLCVDLLLCISFGRQGRNGKGLCVHVCVFRHMKEFAAFVSAVLSEDLKQDSCLECNWLKLLFCFLFFIWTKVPHKTLRDGFCSLMYLWYYYFIYYLYCNNVEDQDLVMLRTRILLCLEQMKLNKKKRKKPDPQQTNSVFFSWWGTTTQIDFKKGLKDSVLVIKPLACCLGNLVNGKPWGNMTAGEVVGDVARALKSPGLREGDEEVQIWMWWLRVKL